MTSPDAGAVKKNGRFITFEGGEGAGKSTQIRMLAEHLEAEHIDTLITREPGGSPGAEIIRHVLLSGIAREFGADVETMLFAAARDDHVHAVIQPALTKGTWVLCDRFTDSTAAYQGKVGSVDPEFIRTLELITIGDMKPDLTFILDVPVSIGMERANKRRGKAAADRFEQENVSFHEKLRDAYRQIAEENPGRCVLIDADADAGVVANRIWAALKARLLSSPAVEHAT